MERLQMSVTLWVCTSHFDQLSVFRDAYGMESKSLLHTFLNIWSSKCSFMVLFISVVRRRSTWQHGQVRWKWFDVCWGMVRWWMPWPGWVSSQCWGLFTSNKHIPFIVYTQVASFALASVCVIFFYLSAPFVFVLHFQQICTTFSSINHRRTRLPSTLHPAWEKLILSSYCCSTWLIQMPLPPMAILPSTLQPGRAR